jgi:hypothetical protein
MHACFEDPSPPYFFLRLHSMHVRQSSRVQPSHTPHRVIRLPLEEEAKGVAAVAAAAVTAGATGGVDGVGVDGVGGGGVGGLGGDDVLIVWTMVTQEAHFRTDDV